MHTEKPMDDFNRDIVERCLKNGSVEIYTEWAPHYDKFLASVNSKVQTSVCKLWAEYHPNVNKTEHLLLDAGCGTGQIGDEMVKQFGRSGLMKMYGGDFCPKMLELARKKGVYFDLKEINLKKELPFQAETFDSIICCGTFLPGTCGPECLPNIIRVLKKNCYFIASARLNFYEETKMEWARQAKECGCEIVEEKAIEYNDISEGIALVFKRL